jgi:hypothetical protein
MLLRSCPLRRRLDAFPVFVWLGLSAAALVLVYEDVKSRIWRR